MSEIILDVSANTHKNDWEYLKKMLDKVKELDTGKHKIIIKHQLFEKAGENIPLDSALFYMAYYYAKEQLGYETTASVFDIPSLKVLLNYEVPFVKIANNRNLDYLIGKIPREIPVYVSCSNEKENVQLLSDHFKIVPFCCVSNYEGASVEEYEESHNPEDLRYCISDHTTDWELFKKYTPRRIEVHYKLEDSTGLDAGPFARTPAQLAEVL